MTEFAGIIDFSDQIAHQVKTYDPVNNTVSVLLGSRPEGRRRYDTNSAVELVRFVRNCYAHASHETRTVPFQKSVLKECALFKKFPSMLIEVYKAVMAHGWDQRAETQLALGHKSRE